MSFLKVHRGDDEIVNILVQSPDTDSEAREPGDPGYELTLEPTDLTGADLTFIVKRYPSDADVDALITKVTPTEITVASPTTGRAVIAIADTDTDDIAPGTYWWELQSIDSSSKVATLASGRFNVVPDLVRTGP